MYGKTLREIRFSRILANERMVFGSTGAVQGEEEELRRLESENRWDEAGAILKKAVETLSEGMNTVLFDAGGRPSVMVEVPAITGADMPAGIRLSGAHPAFRVGGKTLRRVWVSKYINTLVDGKAVSLPMAQPARIPSFDAAVRSIEGKGAGWMPMPFPLRAAILLRCLKESREISGNTDSGRDYYRRGETGILTEDGTVLCGSGPVSWTHNGNPAGIWDLSGNLNEWDAGFRLADGEIQLMDTADMAFPDCDYGKDSPFWYALDREGKPARPGTSGTLHFSGRNGVIRLAAGIPEPGTGNCAFAYMAAEDGLEIPELLKEIGLLPPSAGLSERLGWRWILTEGEVLPLSGGAFCITYHSGPFFMGATRPRNADYALAGIRSVFVSPGDTEDL